jgi:hypothetical protein
MDLSRVPTHRANIKELACRPGIVIFDTYTGHAFEILGSCREPELREHFLDIKVIQSQNVDSVPNNCPNCQQFLSKCLEKKHKPYFINEDKINDTDL